MKDESIFTNTGRVKASYKSALWDHITQTNIDSFNGHLSDSKIKKKYSEFCKMVDKIVEKP